MTKENIIGTDQGSYEQDKRIEFSEDVGKRRKIYLNIQTNTPLKIDHFTRANVIRWLPKSLTTVLPLEKENYLENAHRVQPCEPVSWVAFDDTQVP